MEGGISIFSRHLHKNALLGLLALTSLIAHLSLGAFNLIISLVVALSKAILIALFFMHLKGSSRLLYFVGASACLRLFILMALTFSDYLWRNDDAHPSSFR